MKRDAIIIYYDDSRMVTVPVTVIYKIVLLSVCIF